MGALSCAMSGHKWPQPLHICIRPCVFHLINDRVLPKMVNPKPKAVTKGVVHTVKEVLLVTDNTKQCEVYE